MVQFAQRALAGNQGSSVRDHAMIIMLHDASGCNCCHTLMISKYPQKFRYLRKILGVQRLRRRVPTRSVEVLILDRMEVQYLDTFVAQRITLIGRSLSTNGTLRGFVVMNFPGLFGERLSNVLAVFDNGLDQLSIQRHRLNAYRHQGCTGRRRRSELRGTGRYGNCRRNAPYVVAVALRTTDEIPLQLIFEIFSAAKPALEFVVVVATEVVDDHGLVLGARDGNRTRTLKEREILSLLCLPISPPGRVVDYIGDPT